MSHDGKDHVLEEIKKLKEVEEDIDKLAKKYSHRVLWLGFGYLTLQMLLIFRLTFWELSWDVMEPIAYFVTNITLLVGYAFFMFTSKHPTYQNLVNIFSSAKKKKLMKSRNFDIAKLHELERRYGPCFTAKSIVS
ncbi:hypothetical protein KP509_25G039800 [Ceratopteris richardii]|nr:hypothetical protein KP509_25G039800 [Ceratopteris richardii]